MEIERARIETKPQKTLREYTRQKEMQAAKEDELERQIIENGGRLLTLAIVSSDSEQEGGKTQLQQPKPPPPPRSLPRSPPSLRRRSYDSTSSEEEETEEQAQERKAREEERKIREEEEEREREKEEDRKRALRLLDEQDPELADLAYQAEVLPGPLSFQALEQYRRYRERNPLQAAEDTWKRRR